MTWTTPDDHRRPLVLEQGRARPKIARTTNGSRQPAAVSGTPAHLEIIGRQPHRGRA
jgi:hypothetical protein